jgi:hypothetical protein
MNFVKESSQTHLGLTSSGDQPNVDQLPVKFPIQQTTPHAKEMLSLPVTRGQREDASSSAELGIKRLSLATAEENRSNPPSSLHSDTVALSQPSAFDVNQAWLPNPGSSAMLRGSLLPPYKDCFSPFCPPLPHGITTVRTQFMPREHHWGMAAPAANPYDLWNPFLVSNQTAPYDPRYRNDATATSQLFQPSISQARLPTSEPSTIYQDRPSEDSVSHYLPSLHSSTTMARLQPPPREHYWATVPPVVNPNHLWNGSQVVANSAESSNVSWPHPMRYSENNSSYFGDITHPLPITGDYGTSRNVGLPSGHNLHPSRFGSSTI